MHMQTFFELHPDHTKFSHNLAELSNYLKDCAKKPIGCQMIHLLKTILTESILNSNQFD